MEDGYACSGEVCPSSICHRGNNATVTGIHVNNHTYPQEHGAHYCLCGTTDGQWEMIAGDDLSGVNSHLLEISVMRANV